MGEIESFEKQYLEKGFASQRQYPNEQLIAFLGSNYFCLSKEERKKLKVLELGCGSGANLWMVAREGFDAYGIDYASTGLKFCDEMMDIWGGVKADIRLGDMTQLPYLENEFDVIFDVVSMQHLTFDQHFDAYREIARCLKEGGRFFSYHLGENSISLKSTEKMLDHCTVRNIENGFPLANNGPTCFLSANEVRRFLNDAGFSRVMIEKVTRSYNNQKSYLEYLVITAIL